MSTNLQIYERHKLRETMEVKKETENLMSKHPNKIPIIILNPNPNV